MPFTFSHPAIVLPLMKINQKYISISALAAGSMAPDFEYFIRMKMQQVHGHTLSGIFYFDLPLTIALCFLFHWTIRDALITYSPFPIKAHLKSFYGFDFNKRFRRSWFVIIYSALIGICSHLFWDNFTHANRYFVNMIPFLQVENVIYGVRILNCEIAQVLFSLMGAISLILASFDLNIRKIRKQNFLGISIYWGIVVLTMLILLKIRNTSSLNLLIATSISGGLIGMMFAAVIMKRFYLERKILHK
jgi:Domain of unknown function (DUF4184)